MKKVQYGNVKVMHLTSAENLESMIGRTVISYHTFSTFGTVDPLGIVTDVFYNTSHNQHANYAPPGTSIHIELAVHNDLMLETYPVRSDFGLGTWEQRYCPFSADEYDSTFSVKIEGMTFPTFKFCLHKRHSRPTKIAWLE
jgi:hypothetical protein